MGVSPTKTWPAGKCSTCGEQHPIPKAQTRCRSCLAVARKLRYDTNPSSRTRAIENAKRQYRKDTKRVIKRNSEWRRSTPKGRACRIADKARRRGVRGPQEPSMTEWIEILRHDPCAYCGLQFENIEHIVPLSRGGEHEIMNLTSSCSSCNNQKRCKPLLEFLLERR